VEVSISCCNELDLVSNDWVFAFKSVPFAFSSTWNLWHHSAKLVSNKHLGLAQSLRAAVTSVLDSHLRNGVHTISEVAFPELTNTSVSVEKYVIITQNISCWELVVVVS